MKRFSFLIIALLLYCGNAFAVTGDTVTFTAGDKNASNIYRLYLQRVLGGTNSYVTYAQDTGINYPYLESTTNLTLAYYQSGLIMGVYPSANHSQFTLPTAVPGMDFYFVDGDSLGHTWAIEIQPTDVIAFLGETVGKGINNTSAAQGDQIELFCVFAGQWLVKDKLGTWVIGN
jgi:hypothetical protein